MINEQIVRRLDPFYHFLKVAAQCNGEIIDFRKIARDVGVDDKTIKSYYDVLEDILIGSMVKPHEALSRKSPAQKPKFYFFDTGVVRAFSRLTTVPLVQQTHTYDNAFEHFIVLECLKLNNYYQKDYRFNYLRTASDLDIDLVIERPSKPLLCLEINSSPDVNAEDIANFITLTRDIPDCEAVVLSRDKSAKKFEHVTVLPWQQAVADLFVTRQT